MASITTASRTDDVATLVLDDATGLVAGEHVRQPAEVAGSLHVVLPAQRIHAAARDAHVAGKHRKVGDSQHVLVAHGVLSDAHRVKDRRRAVFTKDMRCPNQIVSRHARDLTDPFRRIFVNHCPP